MIARLEHMLESQRRLLADTSHELRNPITIIRGNLALLRREDAAVPAATRREAILEAEDEAARMGRLVGDLLFLARADAGETPSLQRDEVDLSELASEVVERVRPQARAQALHLAADSSCVVDGDRDRLRQLLANLLENAIRYTPPGGRIDVSVRSAPARHSVQHRRGFARSRSAREGLEDFDMAVVTVRDSGIGIASSDLPHLFERFYRADKARSRAQGGSGLGLSIAEYIVHAHGGTISASSDGADRGSIFTVCLPMIATTQRDKRTANSAGERRTAVSR
jgi:signal transduction histidine kinase